MAPLCQKRGKRARTLTADHDRSPFVTSKAFDRPAVLQFRPTMRGEHLGPDTRRDRRRLPLPILAAESGTERAVVRHLGDFSLDPWLCLTWHSCPNSSNFAD